jgi:WD40 repeat protein
LAVSHDGKSFAVRVGPAEVALFSTRTLQRLASFTVEPAGTVITALAWSPIAPELAVGGHSGLVELWRVDGTPRLVRPLNGGLQPILGKPEAIQSIAFSPGGQLVAASNNSETVVTGASGSRDPEHLNDRLASLVIWRARSGKVTARSDLGTGSAHVDPLAFSPDGRFVAVAAPNSKDVIIDASTGGALRTVQPTGDEYTASLAFAPDGTLATGTVSGIVQLWNPISGAQVGGTIPVSAGPVSSIAFDPRGERMATTASDDGTVKLFASFTLQQEGAALNTDPQSASAAMFGRDDSTLLVVNDRGNGFAWPMSPAAWERRACTVAGRNLTRGEWARYLPGQAYAAVCP